jgi:hypothetical protein
VRDRKFDVDNPNDPFYQKQKLKIEEMTNLPPFVEEENPLTERNPNIWKIGDKSYINGAKSAPMRRDQRPGSYMNDPFK